MSARGKRPTLVPVLRCTLQTPGRVGLRQPRLLSVLPSTTKTMLARPGGSRGQSQAKSILPLENLIRQETGQLVLGIGAIVRVGSVATQSHLPTAIQEEQKRKPVKEAIC